MGSAKELESGIVHLLVWRGGISSIMIKVWMSEEHVFICNLADMMIAYELL